MKTFALLALTFLGSSSLLAQESGSWHPGALAVRCSGSAWHVAEAWDFTKGRLDLPQAIPADIEKIQLTVSAQSYELGSAMEAIATSLEEAPGSFEMGAAPTLPLPSNCEARLVSRLFVRTDGSIRVFFDRGLLHALPEIERAIVRIRNRFNATTKDFFELGTFAFLRALLSDDPAQLSLAQWTETQLHLGLRYPQLNGIPVYALGYIGASRRSDSPLLLNLGGLRVSADSFRISCESSFKAHGSSLQDVLKNCNFSLSGGKAIRPGEILEKYLGISPRFEVGILISLEWDRSLGLTLKTRRDWTGDLLSSGVSAEFPLPGTSHRRWTIEEMRISPQGGMLSASIATPDSISFRNWGAFPFAIEFPQGFAGSVIQSLRSPSGRYLSFEGNLPRGGTIRLGSLSFESARSFTIRSDTPSLVLQEYPHPLPQGMRIENWLEDQCAHFSKIVVGVDSAGKPLLEAATCKNGTIRIPGSRWLPEHSGEWQYIRRDQGLYFDPMPEIGTHALPEWPGVFSPGSDPVQLQRLYQDQRAEGYSRTRTVILFGAALPLRGLKWSVDPVGGMAEYGVSSRRDSLPQPIRLSSPKGVPLMIAGIDSLEVVVGSAPEASQLKMEVSLAAPAKVPCPNGKWIQVKAGIVSRFSYSDDKGLLFGPRSWEVAECKLRPPK